MFDSLDQGENLRMGNYVAKLTFADQLQAGVPEPETWTMMILGFGGIGAALRRRRSVTLAA